MNTKMLALGALLLCSCALTLLADDPPAADEATTRVVKFGGTRNGAAGGRPVLMLRAASKYGTGPAVEIAVPNADPNAQRPDPDAAMARVLRAAKEGDFLKVTYARQQGRFMLSAVEAYTPKPGEVDPEAWEFIKTAEATFAGQTVPAVVLSKLEKEQTLVIPGAKDDQGAFVPDAKVQAQVAKCAAGDFFDVLTSRAGSDTTLRGIYPYQEPQSAAFVKVATAKAESGDVETTVTLKKGEQELQLKIPAARPGGPADPVIMSKVRPLQANAPVLYKGVDDDGALCLIDIKAEPREAMPAGDVVMTGTFVWNGKRNQTNDLKAVLTPTGPGQYKAVYTFTWNGTPKTYVGTVTGNLRNGDVSGTGDGDRRNFTFTGTAKNGVIDMKCFETTGGRTASQGFGTLRLGGA